MYNRKYEQTHIITYTIIFSTLWNSPKYIRGKHVQSFYSRDELAEAEKERSKYVRNISKSHQRNMRLDRARLGNKQSTGEQGPLYNFLNEKKNNSI